MKAALVRHWHTQQFNPGVFGVFVNPFFLARRRLWSEMVALSPLARGRLLDVGCGSKPYRRLFTVSEYIGLEIDSAEARHRAVAEAYYDGRHFPFEAGRFDTVLCNQVLEHVFEPDHFIAEVQRVLVPGGRLILTVPFVWDEHEQPHDYARYSSFGLRALIERNGFQISVQHKLMADSSLLFQLLNAYLYKVLRSRRRVLNLLITALLLAPISLLGWGLGRLLPSNPDLFLDQSVVAERTP
jgi:SAM-dependent methyltransferase